MGLVRRLRRLARAHIADFRADLRADVLGESDPSLREEEQTIGADASRARTSTTASASSAEVPPPVARAYAALEVPVGSGRKAVKAGYRRVMKKYHQDRFDEDPERRAVAGEVSKRLNRAYQTVSDYLDARS